MAKSQLRSNREPKKPKKDKPKAAPAAADSVWATLEKAQARDSLGKKR